MISRGYLALYVFSVLLCMTLWLSGVYHHSQEFLIYSMFYGIILPCVYALLTFVKILLCRGVGVKYIAKHLEVCPVRVVAGGSSIIETTILSYSLAVVTVLSLAFLFGIKVSVENQPHQLLQATPLAVLLVFLLEIPVGTMEEGVFRQAIPETLALIGGHPLFYAFLSSMLFGVMHLWAYHSIFLTISATVVGIINSLIYYGYLGVEAGSIEGIALGHALYNCTVILLPTDVVVALVYPICIMLILIILLLPKKAVERTYVGRVIQYG